MKKIQIFDPPMCCSTGVCQTGDVDPELVRIINDIKWLARQDVVVKRYNLAQRPEVFIENQVVYRTINDLGVGVLPLVLADDEIVCYGRYPSRDELSRYAGLVNNTEAEENGVLTLDVLEEYGKAGAG